MYSGIQHIVLDEKENIVSRLEELFRSSGRDYTRTNRFASMDWEFKYMGVPLMLLVVTADAIDYYEKHLETDEFPKWLKKSMAIKEHYNVFFDITKESNKSLVLLVDKERMLDSRLLKTVGERIAEQFTGWLVDETKKSLIEGLGPTIEEVEYRPSKPDFLDGLDIRLLG